MADAAQAITQAIPADPELDEIVRRLVAAYQPERVYLFGSKARGDAGSDSDYDLALVLKDLPEPAFRIAKAAHSLLWGIGVAADIHVWSREDFDWRATWASSRRQSRARASCSMPRNRRALQINGLQ